MAQIQIDLNESWTVPGQKYAQCVDFHTTRKWIVIGRHHGLVELWNYEHHTLLHTFFHKHNSTPCPRCNRVHQLTTRCVAFHAFKNIIAAGNDNYNVELFHYNILQNGVESTELEEKSFIHDNYNNINCDIALSSQETVYKHLDCVCAMKFYPYEFVTNQNDIKTRLILSCGNDRVARIWDFESKQELAVLRGHKGCVMCCQWCIIPSTNIKNHDQRSYVLTGSLDRSFRLWRIFIGNIDSQIKIFFTTIFKYKNAIRRAQITWIDIDWYYPCNHDTLFAFSKKENTRLDMIQVLASDDAANIGLRQIIIDENDNVVEHFEQKIVGHSDSVGCAQFYHPSTINDKDNNYCFVFSVSEDRTLGVWCLSKDNMVVNKQTFAINEFGSYGNFSRGWHITTNKQNDFMAVSHDYGVTVHKIKAVSVSSRSINHGCDVYVTKDGHFVILLTRLTI